MTEKCKPKYKNLNEIQSYSEQKYATVQWCEQNCQNDEYLKQEVDELNYRSPARIRKRWKPILVDDANSFGYMMNRDPETNNQVACFSNVTEKTFTIDFSDFTNIDLERSDCDFVTFFDGQGVLHKRATVPKERTSVLDTSCRNFSPEEAINSFWYVGFDKNKQYHVRPDWIKDNFDIEIPGVCRAQTITIPEGITNGRLDSVDLKVQNNGTTNSNWGSPLYVQIWKTTPVTVEKTKWNEKKKRGDSYNPKQYETIYFPSGTPKTALATSVYQPNITTPSLHNFKFDKSIVVNSGEHYAIVMMSPLSHWDHCPRIGGWGRNCAVEKYEGGDAFLSENNAQTWERFGKMDYTLNQYNLGIYTPMDFCFIAHIWEYVENYNKDENFYLYLNPIHENPIKSLQLVPVGYGNETQLTNLDLVFEVSTSGKADSWVALDATSLAIQFNKDSQGNYPHFAFIRVRMKTKTVYDAPYLNSLKVIVEMDSPKEMYVRTHPYNPKTTPMLGATAWSKFFTNFNTDPQVTGTAEIISEKIGIEHFHIITANELPTYAYIEGLDAEKMTDESLEVRYNYLMNDVNALKILKANKVYVKPYTYTANNQTVTHPMSFDDGIQFDNSPAYPMLNGTINPLNNENEIPIAEWIDYTFDYDNDKLYFNEVLNKYIDNGSTVEEGVEEYLPVGTLEITYHPVFIQNLSAEDVGFREDSEGFILDYFKEEFIINESDVENRSIQLKVTPCDPIRELVIDEEELIEDIDFTVDYLNRRIDFPIIDINESATILNDNIGKDMHVVYTPNLEDTGLILAYRGVRKNTDKQMKIYDNYIEYKV